tara:strand:+ start:2345 stop:2584 length:240 start_codon:yes stop_codon:yes gene_type:complete
MKDKIIKIYWPNGSCSYAKEGDSWLNTAKAAGVEIPTGCLGGSCGACEIEVNGKVLRACVHEIPNKKVLNVDFYSDPYW